MKKSTDSNSDSSEERNEAIVEDVFEKYSTNGQMSRSQFVLVLAKLSEHISEIRGIEVVQVEAAFNLFSAHGQHISLGEFKRWWSASNKFSFFTGKKSKLLTKAYILYKKYSSNGTLKTSTEGDNLKDLRSSRMDNPGNASFSHRKVSIDGLPPRRMSLHEFSQLLEDLSITSEGGDDDEGVNDEFDEIDTDGDGVLSFREFCAWLKWF